MVSMTTAMLRSPSVAARSISSFLAFILIPQVSAAVVVSWNDNRISQFTSMPISHVNSDSFFMVYQCIINAKYLWSFIGWVSTFAVSNVSYFLAIFSTPILISIPHLTQLTRQTFDQILKINFITYVQYTARKLNATIYEKVRCRLR